ncbi:hypothetical protein GCM10009808_03370 [Microbacterium sediminicola]|uniref:Arginase n=1 Tax=Microbacterium sediminicola TaxID=415210 RepID=A0ABN2HLD2_9MICO
MAHFVVVPQWQGSASARAMQLIDGAAAIRGDLPSSACTAVEVPAEAGESQGTGVRRLSSLVRTWERVREAVAAAPPPPIVIGGDRGIAAAAADGTVGSDVGLIWFDARAALHDPDPLTPRAFEDSTLRAILGGGPAALRLPAGRIDPTRVVLAGVREIEEAEVRAIADLGISRVTVEGLRSPDALRAALISTGVSRVFIHLDLSVIDPSGITGVSAPVPFGPDAATLITRIRDVRAIAEMTGASLTGFAPASPDTAIEDLPTVLRLIGALA